MGMTSPTWFRLLFKSLAVSFFAIGVIPSIQAQEEELTNSGRNHAVLIAVQHFQNDAAFPPLQNTVNDMNALGDILERRYGFEVTRLFNEQATLNRVVMELRERLPNRVEEGDSVLVAFATHGKYSENDREGYLILEDTENYKTGISLSQLNQFTKNRKLERARAVLFIIDACEIGAVETVEFRSVNVRPEVVLRKFRGIVTSAGYVRVADASPTNPLHSPFAEALLDALDRDNKPKQLYDLLLDISRDVKRKTAGNQMPRQRKLPSDQDGDFIFQPPGVVRAATQRGDGFEMLREQIAQSLRAANDPQDDRARRQATMVVLANKSLFDSMPSDLQRDYVQLLTAAFSPESPEWQGEQNWLEEVLPRGGDMGRVKLAQLFLHSGRTEKGVELLEDIARPIATRSAAGEATSRPTLRAGASAALLQLGALKYQEWQENKAFDAFAEAAIERFAQASSLAMEAGQITIAAGIRLRIGHIHEEVLHHAVLELAKTRAPQAAARALEHGQGAIEAYANGGVPGRIRLAQLRAWLVTQQVRLQQTNRAADSELRTNIEELINMAIREQTRL
jgi:hypothetical protein